MHYFYGLSGNLALRCRHPRCAGGIRKVNMTVVLAIGLIIIGSLIKAGAKHPTDPPGVIGIFLVIVGGLMLWIGGKKN